MGRLADKLPKASYEEYFRLGHANHVAGQLFDAADDYLNAIRLNPEHFSAHKNLAHLYLAMVNVKKAQEHWFRVGKAGPSARQARIRGQRQAGARGMEFGTASTGAVCT